MQEQLLDAVTQGMNVSLVAAPFFVAVPNSDYVFAVILYGTQKELDLYVATLASFHHRTPEWKKICDATDEVKLFDVHRELGRDSTASTNTIRKPIKSWRQGYNRKVTMTHRMI